MITNPRKKQGQVGFTLIELLIVIAIVGILVAVAIPVFMRQMQKTKTHEAKQQLEHIAQGAVRYFKENRGQFPDSAGTTMTPMATCCGEADATHDGNGKCIPAATDWDDQGWRDLGFAMGDPHYYRYTFESDNTSHPNTFIVSATGDLDCDGNLATFTLIGTADATNSDGVAIEWPTPTDPEE